MRFQGQPTTATKEATTQTANSTTFLYSVRSITKDDELRLSVSVTVVSYESETWLQPFIPHSAIELAGHMAHFHDQITDSGKSRGVGVMLSVKMTVDAKMLSLLLEIVPQIWNI